jgi:hypothetical protein
MLCRRLLGVLLCWFSVSWTAFGEIELISFKQEENPRISRLSIAIKVEKANMQTIVNLANPGSCGTRLDDGTEKVMLSNKDSSIVAFNFQPGTKVNDCIAIALLPSGKLVYFFDLNHTVSELVKNSKKNLDEAAFRVVDVAGDRIVLEYYEHYSGSENLNFRVRARVSEDGNLQVRAEDVKKDLSRQN